MKRTVRGMAAPAAVAVLAAGLAGSAGLMMMQDGAAPVAAAANGTQRATALSGRENLARLMKPVTVNLAETRLEDALKFIQEQTGAEFEVLYRTETESDGLDPEFLVNVEVRGLSALQLLEKILDQARDGFAQNSWQLAEWGAVQVGPKSRLNRFKRVQIYDINDLLFVLPQYDNAPQVDLDRVLQSSGGGRGGGGAGGSPFKSNNTNQNKNNKSKEERAREVIDIIISTIEPEQWADNGGEGGAITYKEVFSGQLIVNAADYLHRELNGYPWLPQTRPAGTATRRYVTMDAAPSASQVQGVRTAPIGTAP
jgi:hypothetical protein